MLFTTLARVPDIWEWIGIVFHSGLVGEGWRWICAGFEIFDAGFALDNPAQSRQLEHMSNMLTAGCNLWVTSNHFTTTRGAVLFKQLPNGNMVSSSFEYYRDCFLFALSVAWDVDVQRFDLALEQSEAAFGYVDIMKHATRISPPRGPRGRWTGQALTVEDAGDAGKSIYQPTPQGQQDGGASGGTTTSTSDGEMKNAPTKHNLKLLRKRAGVTRWTQKLCRLLKGYLAAVPHAQGARGNENRGHMGLVCTSRAQEKLHRT